MEQSDADRAAVAREVLTELEVWLDNGDRPTVAAGVIREFKTQRYPAPAPPETVTVTVGGRVWAREVDGWWVHHSDTSHDVCGPKSTIGEMCARIASDARVIRELERSRDGWDADARREAGNVLYWRGERDRAIEAIKERDARIAELERQGAVIVGDCLAAQHARRKAEAERDAALRALEEKGAGTLPKGASASEESQAAGSLREAPTSPAPIPLGAVVSDYSWLGAAWAHRNAHNADMEPLLVSVNTDLHRALTGWYHATHPVATRETVERVDNALRLADQSRSYLAPGHHYAKLTRAAPR